MTRIKVKSHKRKGRIVKQHSRKIRKNITFFKELAKPDEPSIMEVSDEEARELGLQEDLKRLEAEKKIKKEAFVPQSLWHAGDESPSEHLKQGKPLFGFSNKEYADQWKDDHNYSKVYKFTTDNYALDDKSYVRNTPSGRKMNDNEYVAGNVLDEEEVD